MAQHFDSNNKRDESGLLLLTSLKRNHRQQNQKRIITQDNVVDAANHLTGQEFFGRFCPQNIVEKLLLNQCAGLTEDSGPARLEVLLMDAKGIDKAQLLDLVDLVRDTSAQDYQQSGMGWHQTAKLKEMRLPDMKYIILRENNKHRSLAGFVSFMVTYEDQKEVIYIYEIHFTTAWQGKGLGVRLMQLVEIIGREVGVEKVMLTVFKANVRAVNWYAKLGYSKDEFSPGPRTFRDGTVKEPTYLILSKPFRVVKLSTKKTGNG